MKVTACEAGVGPQEALDALGLEPETKIGRGPGQGFDAAAPRWLETRYYPLKFREILSDGIMSTVAINGLLIRLGFPITGNAGDSMRTPHPPAVPSAPRF